MALVLFVGLDIALLVFLGPYTDLQIFPSVPLWVFTLLNLFYAQSHYRRFGAIDQAHEALAAMVLLVIIAVPHFHWLNIQLRFIEINVSALMRPDIRHVWMTL